VSDDGGVGDGRDRTPSSADVCVIGAGPAGALVSKSLAEQGYDVVVLEAGPRFDERGRETRMERSIRPGYGPLEVWDMGGPRDAFSSSGERFYPLNAARVKGVGGTTLHWQGMVMRLRESDFRRRSESGYGADWPIDYGDLRPYYARAEEELGVAGALDNPHAPPREGPYPLPAFEPSYSDSMFAEACERLGLDMHSVPNARNSEPYDDRGPCVGYGTCKPVCPSGGKYSADHTVARAESLGVRVVDHAAVQRLETDDPERVSHAVYATPDGREHRQEAERFVLAAGGVETPRLLLLSASPVHPDGLANGSGAVGRYFHEHLFAGMGGTLDRETGQNHVGFITSECHGFYDRPGRATEGTDGGVPGSDADLAPFKLEFLNYAGPSPVEVAMGAEDWGDALLSELREAYGTHIAMGALVEQTPRAENRITLDSSTTDDHGNPVPDVEWSLDGRTRRTLSRANEVQRAVLEELGCDIGWTVGPENTGPAFHHMGTTRMGEDPDSSVVAPDLTCHEVGNLHVASSSVFPTGGAMNPTLTIAALSLKCAEGVAEALGEPSGA
jgi:choline dehydrogenase-like flavoprotein